MGVISEANRGLTWSAADHEKERFHGSFAVLSRFIAFRRPEASDSDCPPLRKLAVFIAVGKHLA